MGKGNVPFSWEDMPGISKAETDQKPRYLPASNNKLPPPPVPRSHNARKILSYEIQDIPLPPCAFQPPPPVPPRRTSSKKGLRMDDDPFLVAYRECMKSSREAKKSPKHIAVSGLFRKQMSVLSCKRSCSVRDDNTIRISHSES